MGLASNSPTKDPLFSPDKVKLYKKRYEEGYDLDDPSYTAWLKIYHPTEVCSTTTKSLSSLVLSKDSAGSGKSKLSSDDALSEILVLPHPVPRNKSKCNPTLNDKAVCITKDNVLKDLKKKEAEKAEAEKEKEAKRLEAKRLERERKKKIREEKRLEREQKKKVREEKRLFEEQKKKKRAVKPVKSGQKTRSRTQGRVIDDVLASLHLSSSSDSDEDSDSPGDSEDNTTCPKCGTLIALSHEFVVMAVTHGSTKVVQI